MVELCTAGLGAMWAKRWSVMSSNSSVRARRAGVIWGGGLGVKFVLRVGGGLVWGWSGSGGGG